MKFVVNAPKDTWIQEGVVGTLPKPSWGQLDVRAEYKKSFGGLGTEFFVDISTSRQPVGDPYPGSLCRQWRHDFKSRPASSIRKRFFLGARLSF